MKSELLKQQIINAGRTAVQQLIKVAKEDIIKPDPENLYDFCEYGSKKMSTLFCVFKNSLLS